MHILLSAARHGNDPYASSGVAAIAIAITAFMGFCISRINKSAAELECTAQADKALSVLLSGLSWRLTKGRAGYLMFPFNFTKKPVSKARLWRLEESINQILAEEQQNIRVNCVTQVDADYILEVSVAA